ncbi:complex I subunit 4 family protein [Evansella clarkii]|uniref:complex I subunit 4 family protein n=1 Tax=Evansella clarkii TaxID=79879 RepID=UPI00099644DE|nr:NADH-quinone oxidoreductase subunit M [Evansella clarkii]
MIPNILSWLVFLPLAGALLILAIPKENKNVIRSLAAVTVLAAVLLSILVWISFDRTVSGMQFQQLIPWIDLGFVQINYEIGVDGLSVPMLALSSIVTALAVFASFNIQERVKEFYIFILILLTGLFGVFVALDLFLFFLFFELTLIPMFFIIGIWGGKQKTFASFKYLIYTGISGAILIMSFIAIYFIGMQASGWTHSTFSIPALAEIYANPAAPEVLTSGIRGALFLALFIAFAIKIPVFPFHTWQPIAYAEAPTAATMILSGVLLKMGGYGLIRIGIGVFPDQVARFATLIAILGVINIIYGAVLALVQNDLKRLVAFASISHMGIVLLGIASFTAAGIQGAIFQLVSHGFITALLFFMVGALAERTNTRNISELGGLSKSVPVLAGFTLAAVMAAIGLPGLSGFVSELLTLIGVFGAPADILPAAAVFGVLAGLGIILTAAYLLWAVKRTTFGPMQEKYSTLKDARPIEYIPMVGLLGLSLLIGVYPTILTDVINVTVTDILSRIGG